MYSTAPGSVAEEASRGTFVGELIKQIQSPDLMLDEIFNRTRIAVSETSQGERVPWFSSSLTDDFSFGPAVSNAAEKATATAPQPASRVGDDRKAVVPVPPERKAEQSAEPKTAAVNPSTPPPARPQPADAAKPAAEGISSPPDRAAIETLDARLKDNPKDATAFYKRGQLYTKNGLFARAAADFDAAIQLNPNDPDLLNNRCWVRAMYADLQLALQDCNEALRLRPGFAEALDSRGLVNLKLSLMKNAIADYDAALQIRPNLASSLYGRGISKQRSGKTAEGDADIAAAKALDARIAEEFVRYGIR
jgi:tetratricopeptide (TPR) repeat protein